MKTLIFFLLLSITVRSQDITVKSPLTPPNALTFTTSTGLGNISSVSTINVASDVTLNDNNTLQPVFGSANDVATLQGNTTYRVKGYYTFASGATSASVNIAFLAGGGLTITDMNLCVSSFSADANVLQSSLRMMRLTTLSATSTITASTVTTKHVWFDGTIRINAAGTLTPQMQFSVQTNGTTLTKTGSFIEFIPIGNGSVSAVGPFN